MSEAFTCIPLEKLVAWIVAEEKTGSIFGIQKDLFFTPKAGDPFKMERYHRVLETPLGVAAGPHTQLSQNIITAWLTGARYLELKTVQVLDELSVTKPCIKMEDEGYNCEWSQELKLEQSYHEYLNAWIVIHLLRNHFGWDNAKGPRFLFNMSVGYNLEGIKSAGVQRFLDKLTDCHQEKSEKIEGLVPIFPAIHELGIPDRISDNVTISTMHGCPPDEIEKIGRYFIEERKLNTTIKLNPTLLGPERLRSILNKSLGYELVVPDEAFEHDLKYQAAVDLIKNLRQAAAANGVAFGLKLTNTLETLNQPDNLPAHEKMVYMSGRPLHAISINLAAKLQESFAGELDISFSGGVDCFNAPRVLACNLKPITVCTDLLKPGGYARLPQYLEEIERRMALAGTNSVDGYILKTAGQTTNVKQAALENLHHYADEVIQDPRYAKHYFPYSNIKTDRELTLFDCTQAPCLTTCPTEQDIPAYLGFTATGNFEDAHRIILETNPFPNVQGKVCHQPCQSKCTRINLDSPLQIKEIKRFIAERYHDVSRLQKKPATGFKVGIIGGGPSGLSCAYFLALEGFAVDLFEAKAKVGGMAADAIPDFRLDPHSLESDIRRIEALGVRIHLNTPVDKDRFSAMQQQFDCIYIAVGAQESLKLGVPGEDGQGVIDQLEFLSQVKNRQPLAIGKKVLVIGGGNSAMDAARTAKRLVGTEGQVTILYRRTRKQMPADVAEIREAITEGIAIVELVAPEKILQKAGRVVGIECSQMRLGLTDATGRPAPVKIPNSSLRFDADTIIPAIGQKVRLGFLPNGRMTVDPVTFQTDIDGVFAGGDAVRGAATLIEAIADSRRTAEKIVEYAINKNQAVRRSNPARISFSDYQKKLVRRNFGLIKNEVGEPHTLDFKLVSETLTESAAKSEAERCLSCDLYCAICTTVCPNRAHIAFPMAAFDLPLQVVQIQEGKASIIDCGVLPIRQPVQILTIGDFCNECGNCTTFCPANGEPYRVKPKFSLSRETFDFVDNGYYLEGDRLFAKTGSDISHLTIVGDSLVFENRDLKVILAFRTLRAVSVEIKQSGPEQIDLKQAAIMGLLLKSLKDFHAFPKALK